MLYEAEVMPHPTQLHRRTTFLQLCGDFFAFALRRARMPALLTAIAQC
jgi:hypothetical protein